MNTTQHLKVDHPIQYGLKQIRDPHWIKDFIRPAPLTVNWFLFPQQFLILVKKSAASDRLEYGLTQLIAIDISRE